MNNSESRKDSTKKSQKVSKTNFNKKKWRDQMYSAKARVQNWDKIKRRQSLRQYNKELKKSGDSVVFKKNTAFSKPKFKENFKQAQEQYQKIKQEKEEKRKELERVRKEKIEATKIYKEKKAMRYRKLCQKTKKGQPLMKGRIELLLEKIQTVISKQENNS